MKKLKKENAKYAISKAVKIVTKTCNRITKKSLGNNYQGWNAQIYYKEDIVFLRISLNEILLICHQWI